MYCTDQVHADQKLTYQRPTLPTPRHQEARGEQKDVRAPFALRVMQNTYRTREDLRTHGVFVSAP